MTCKTCNFIDTCKHNNDARLRVLPPLSKRGNNPECFECGHNNWLLNVSKNERKCYSCGLIKSMTIDSIKIKHQR